MVDILRPARPLRVVKDVDVCVVGAGPAGLGAAIGAARCGARVALIERHAFMGGNFTAASVGSVCGLYYKNGGSFEHVVGGVVDEIVGKLKSQAKAIGPIPFQESAILLYVPWSAKRLFDDLISSEENVDLFLHAVVSEVVVEGGHLQAVVVSSKQGPVAVTAKAFVDCTGDGDLVFFAGGETVMGGPGQRQHASMQFFLQNADQNVALTRGIPNFGEIIAKHGQHLSRDAGALIPTFRPGEFIGAMTRVTNPDGTPIDITDLDQGTWAEIHGRALAEEAARFVIEEVPGFSGAFLSDCAPNVGIRESRRVIGQYVLSGKDVLEGARFEDPVACGAWPQEYHNQGRSTNYVHLPEGSYYQIPYRSLLPLGFDNLFVAGRCISADFDALASVRVMAPSMALGQAAGVGAYLLARHGKAPYADLRDLLETSGAKLG